MDVFKKIFTPGKPGVPTTSSESATEAIVRPILTTGKDGVGLSRWPMKDHAGTKVSGCQSYVTVYLALRIYSLHL